MEISDPRGRNLTEVTVHLTEDEITELLVAASELDDRTSDHALLRDRDGSTLAVYRRTDEKGPLERGTDWWVGLAVLLLVILVVVGAYTVARSILGLLF
ncbi:MAG: hypothetical protein M3164_08165 [Actinomycetota bacterium]|nr:hypothetical protein [Actinomycetota bacterium]